MFHILLQKIVHNVQGIFVGGFIKIQCATQKVLEGIGREKLLACCRVTAHRKKNAPNAIGCNKRRILNRRRFCSMFKCNFISIFAEIFEAVERG